MTMINDTTVVVYTMAELKTALEGVNYTYIYFGANITLTTGITIAPTKKEIIIDGTYNGIRYTYQDMKSASSGDTISVRNANITKVTVQNIDVTGFNYYGIIYVPEDNSLQNIVIEYNNLTYNGPQCTFHPTGLSRYLDCNINIITAYLAANEVAECNRIEIGGTTTIYHTSTIDSMFWYRGTITPYFKILPNAVVTMTATARELFYGPTNLALLIGQNARLNFTTYHGMGYGTFSTNQVLIDKGAQVSITQTARNGSYPTWYCNGPFTINENASFTMISNYSGITSSNYNICFTSANASMTINNPKQIIFYNKGASAIYSNAQIPFYLTFCRFNRWLKASDITIAGSLQDLPNYAWYKTNDLSTISGTLNASTTIITSNNYTTEELSTLPPLTNFQFQNTPVFSIGKMMLNIDAITDKQTEIQGYTTPLSEVQINYQNTAYIVTADSNGIFQKTLSSPLPEGTEISFIANQPNHFIYQTKNVTVVYSGELTLDFAPKTIQFSMIPFSISPVLCSRSTGLQIQVTDTRIYSSNWKLYAKINHDLKSTNGLTLTDSLVYVDNDNNITPLSTSSIIVYTGESNNGTTKITTVDWPEKQGIILKIENEAVENGVQYETDIIWSIEE